MKPSMHSSVSILATVPYIEADRNVIFSTQAADQIDLFLKRKQIILLYRG